MGLHRNNNNYTDSTYSELDKPEDQATLSHKRQMRKRIEDRLEFKRLQRDCKNDWDELDEDEFDWTEIDK